MHLVAKRLTPGKDLKQTIIEFAAEKNIAAGAIISAVGSLSIANIRMAGAQPDKQDVRELAGPFEIVSLIGTVGIDGEHLHISLSDKDGKVIGGHLKDGCLVETTVELVITVEDRLEFRRDVDPTTGFKELSVVEVG